MIRKRPAPRRLDTDAVVDDGEPRQTWHRCDDGERGRLLHVCISQLSHCCVHAAATAQSASAPGNSAHPNGNNVEPACPDIAQGAVMNHSTEDGSGADSFSIVDWIHRNLPCLPGLQDPQQPPRHEQSAQMEPESPLASTQQTSASCCHLNPTVSCPLTDRVTSQHTETAQKPPTERSKDRPTITALTHTKDPSHASVTNGANSSSSWLSGHLGLIQQTSSSQLPLAQPPSIVKTASLTKPPSFNKTPSCPQPASRSSKEPKATVLATKPPRPLSPAIPPEPLVKRTKSQIIASHLHKLAGSSRNNSRPNTPCNSTMAVHHGCTDMACLTHAHSLDGIDSNSSVGLNSVHGKPGEERNSAKLKHNKRNSDSSCVVVVDPLLLSCGNQHNYDGSMFHQADNATTNHFERTQSKLTVASQSTMDTGGTPATYNTHTLHNILTKSGTNHASSSKIAMSPYEGGNIDVCNAQTKDRFDTLTITNTNGINHDEGVAFLRSESYTNGNMTSQQPSGRNNLSKVDHSSAFSTLMTLNKRSPSPLFAGTQVQLEKLLSRNNSKNNHLHSEFGTITSDGTSGVDSSTKSKAGETSTFSSMSGAAVGEKRKVQWGLSTGGESSKMPVLITANEDSTEVTKRESKTKTCSVSSVDIKLFAKHHEEIVTALIDGALRAKDNEVASSSEPQSPTTATTAPELLTNAPSNANAVIHSPRKSALTPIRKISKSPHRSSLSTPIWKKNRSTNKLDSTGKGQKHEQNISAGSDSNIEKSMSMFHFKTKQSTPLSHSSTTTLNKLPLDYFHPQCQLLKEKGSEKRKPSTDSKTASAIGKEAVLEKLQEKLSMLSDIESGKFGKAAEMLQSDAVAFFIEDGTDSVNRGNQHSCVSKGSNSIGAVLRRTELITTRDSAADSIKASSVGSSKKRKAVVETRSLLTLRMGFVSMSYGILLQWDCASKLVELIVLRKMCREDFLERNEEDSVDAAAVSKSSKPSTASAASTTSGTTLESHESHSHPEGFSRFFPQLLCEPDRSPQSFLSVSVVSVKNIHTGCALCSATTQPDEPNATKSKTKRDTIRPYVRFVLGKNEHCTKTAKLQANGNLYYYKRHNNSCLLPMPREEFRWFAGQEDLVVEVRDMQSIATCSEGGKNPHMKKHVLNGKKTSRVSSKNEQCSSGDPILAVVTVPLSSVNIEEEGDNASTSDDDESIGLSLWKRRKSKRNDLTGKDDSSSTTITLPLRISGCSAAPFGSISLQITIKAPDQKGAPASSATAPSDSDLKTATESKGALDESIEIGAIARLMQGWAIYDAAAACGETDPVHTSAPSKSLSKKIRKQVPRWNKKWNPKTKKWSKLKLNNRNSSGRDPVTEEANWLTFMKWGDDPSNGRR